MSTDNFMMKTARENDGYIEIETLLRFNTVKKISTEAALIARAAEGVSHVVLSRDREAIRRKDPVPEKIDNVPRSLRVKNIPKRDNNYDVTVDEVKEIFSKFGEVSIVRFRFLKADKNRGFDKKCLGEVFVEFKDVDSVVKAMEKAKEVSAKIVPHKREADQ